MKLIVKIILFLIVSAVISKAQDEGLIKTAFIYNFTKDLTWQNEDSIKYFTIAVYGIDTNNIIRGLRNLQKQKQIKNKPIKILSSDNFKELISASPQIIYMTEEKNIELKKRYYDLLGRPILLITNNATNKLYVMINFIYDKENKNIKFELNRSNVEAQGIQINEHLISLGGSELDVRELYKLKVQELKKERQFVRKQQEELKKLEEEIKKKNEQLEAKYAEIEQLKKEIEKQKAELQKQKAQLANLSATLEEKQKLLNHQLLILKQQQDSILLQKQTIEKQKQEIQAKLQHLQKLNKQIAEREKLLEKQKKQVSELKTVVALQRKSLMLAILIGVIIFIGLLIIFWYYRKNRKLNRELRLKNEKIQKQTEELIAINAELEKLSIVARETDNAVLIMNPDGEFIWANEGFEKFYHLTLEDLKKEYGKTIYEATKNPNIKELVNKAINEKISVRYESKFEKKNGEIIWTQTTLTPILDKNGNVKLLVAIDADISKLKEFEHQIKLKNQELLAQTEELQAQKEQIELQNEYITSSIDYAKNIQTSILPKDEFIRQFFDYFIIYFPKDIISGDFYWISHLPAKGEYSEKIFVSVVDCTGHGVPGALMSMLGSRLLSEIVNEHKITNPAEILRTLDQKLRESLQRRQNENFYDGMDLAIVRLEPKENGYTLTMAMAKMPVFIYKKQEAKLHRYKGTPKSIGGMISKYNKADFSNIELSVEKGDIIYLASDGFIDQNNPKRKRFGTVKFMKLLESIAEKPLEEQKKILIETFENWKEGEIQRDDVTIWGIKI